MFKVVSPHQLAKPRHRRWAGQAGSPARGALVSGGGQEREVALSEARPGVAGPQKQPVCPAGATPQREGNLGALSCSLGNEPSV